MNWQVYAMVLWMCLFIGILLGIEDRRLRPAPDPPRGDRIHEEIVTAAAVILASQITAEFFQPRPASYGLWQVLEPGEAIYRGQRVRASMPSDEVLITPDGRHWRSDGHGGWFAFDSMRRGIQ